MEKNAKARIDETKARIDETKAGGGEKKRLTRNENEADGIGFE